MRLVLAVAIGIAGAVSPALADRGTALGAADLERLARQLRSDDVQARRKAVTALLEAEPESTDALRARLFRDYGPNHHRLFNAMREARRRMPTDEDEDVDQLEALVVASRAGDREATETALEIVALVRALAATKTVEATSTLIDFSLREQRVFLREIGRAIHSMRDYAIPGLIRARQHEDRPTRAWCSRILDEMERTQPAVNVQQSDNELLAEILLAYGQVHDPDAMRVIGAFTGSERAAVREAARRALREYGQNALWTLRNAFENHTGEEPPTAWGWERTTRELYARYDQARLAEPNRLLDEGLRHAKAGKTREMLDAFRRALARQPALARRSEMVAPLLTHADDLLEDGEEQEALRMSQLALRLQPTEAEARKLRARIAYLEGRRALAAGVPDQALFAEAVRLDPDLDPAAEALQRLESVRTHGTVRTAQAVLAAGAGLVGIAALIGFAWQRRRRAA